MHLERLVSLLEIVSAAGRPITVAEIQQATGLPKPTCYRLVQSLCEQQLLDQPEGEGKFVIGERLTRIALIGRSDADITDLATPTMKKAANKLNETVFLARRRTKKVEIIHVQTPSHAVRSYIHPGLGERPLHACSCAKAIAAFASDEFQSQVLQSELTEFTKHTRTSPEALRMEFSEIARQGWADCDQEIDIGIASVAAPIKVAKGTADFSLGAVGPIKRFGKAARGKTGKQLKQFAEKMEGAIQLNSAA